MSHRELIVLGTASQVPSRERNQNAYLLRWDGEGFLFDPGEGTQRQLTLAGISASSIHNICITHFHGDHCLGLTGIVQRLSLDGCEHPVHLFYPESGQPYIDRLCSAAIFDSRVELIFHPAPNLCQMLELKRTEEYRLMGYALEHSVPAVGFRVEEPPGFHFIAERLDQEGIRGPMVGELKRKGVIQIGGKQVRLEDVTELRESNIFALVMDTRPCEGAMALAKDADLLVMEATYTSEHEELARLYLHSTALDAARVARTAEVRTLAITHFSQRYPDDAQHLMEAKRVFPDVIALNDLDRVEIHRRQ